jgi:hypothetical protein
VSAPAAPLYVRDGSRFVPLPEVLMRDTPPIPVPATLDEPSPERPVVEVRPGQYRVYAARCPHGRFRGCRARGCPGPS